MLRLVFFSYLLVLALPLFAGSQNEPDPDLPQPLNENFAEELLTHPPFTRVVNLEDSVQLTGLAYVEGRPVVTLYNKNTKEHFTVSESPNPQGWKVTEATPGTELRDTEVQLMIGGEVVTMHYGDAQLSPGPTKKGTPTTRLADGIPDSHSGRKGEDHIRTSSYLGENGKELYSALSRDARDKLKDLVHAYVEKHPDRTVEQASTVALKYYAKIKAADDKANAAGTAKPAKTPKPNKNR